MKTSDSSTRFSRNLLIFTAILGILFVSIPLWLSSDGITNWIPRLTGHTTVLWAIGKVLELTGKVGDALLIAALVAVLVDRAAKRDLIEQVVQAASPKLIGRHLPDLIQEALISYFEIDFFRPEFEIDYDIERVPGHAHALRVTSRITGAIVNCSPAPQDFTFIGSVDPSLIDPSIGASSITHVSMSPEVGEPLFAHSPPHGGGVLKADGSREFTRRETLAPNGRYTTVVELLEYCPTVFSSTLFTSTTVVRTKVTIRYPKDLLEVSLQSPIRDENLHAEETHNGTEWIIRTPLLPGQCVLATWRPKTQLASKQYPSEGL